MVIGQLFQDDINRKINGVVKVDQDATDVLVQELDEYVITRDLKKHCCASGYHHISCVFVYPKL